jgi:heme oxygenase
LQTTLHQYLKEMTRANHNAAEAHPFQGTLANGKLGRAAYVDYLQQLRELHAGFEGKLAEAAKRDDTVKNVMRPEYYQLPFIENDLKALGASHAQPLECVKRFNENQLFDKVPASMIAVLYVLLGSKHGGKFIAHNVKDAYSLDGGGWTYFKPYGDNFMELWKGFTESLNSMPVDEKQRESMLEAASMTFDVFGEMGEKIWQRMEREPEPV